MDNANQGSDNSAGGSTGVTIGDGQPQAPQGDQEPVSPASSPPPTPKDAAAESRARFDEKALVFGSDAYVQKRIEALKKNNIPAVLFLGVRTTGKTWLMQRMKQQLEENTALTLIPEFAVGQESLSSEEVQQRDRERAEQDHLEGQNAQNAASDYGSTERLAHEEGLAASKTDRTDAIIVHRFIDGTNSFALIDVPGENIERLIAKNYSSLRGLMMAFDYAQAIVVAMPADVVLLGNVLPDDEEIEQDPAYKSIRGDALLIDNFAKAIGLIASVRSLLAHENIQVSWKDSDGPADRFDQLVTPEAVEDHLASADFLPIGGPEGRECPAFFALTKSDKIFATLDALPDDADRFPAKKVKFEKANKRAKETETGKMLEKLYQESGLNPANHSAAGDLASKIGLALAGAGESTTRISNPTELVRAFYPKLFNRLVKFMPLHRFDLVSAFYGNTKDSLRLDDFRRMEAIGVNELLSWFGVLHGRGITEWHIWARRVFAKLHPPVKGLGNPFFETPSLPERKRIRFTPAWLLKRMFSKEWNPWQIMPHGLTIAAAVAMVLGSYNFLETTDTLADGALYERLQADLPGDNVDILEAQRVPALAALPSIPEDVDAAEANQWKPEDGLRGWSRQGQAGTYRVPDSYVLSSMLATSPAIAELRAQQARWQANQVCSLDGWGAYRQVVRMAAINGYGECDSIQKLAMRSPVIERFGLSGIFILVLGWLIVIGAVWYTLWYHKVRKAYGWLYHSAIATTRRSPKGDDD